MMSKLQRKLRSRAGASMILALLFLMFCSFVGGSVLVSATANASRVRLHGEQQDFLDQRSAVLLLSDELRLANGQRFRLYVQDADRTINEVRMLDNGWELTGNVHEERIVTFQLLTDANATVTPLQELMIQTSIWRYLRNNAAGEEVIVVVKDKTGAYVDLRSFWYLLPGASVTANTMSGNVAVDCKVQIPEESTTAVTGTMTVSAQLSPNVSGIASLPSYEVRFTSCGEKDPSATEDQVPDDLLDFVLDFGGSSQLKLVMDGYSGTSQPITVEGVPTTGTAPGFTTGAVQIVTVSRQTIVSWSSPEIEKGGV